MWRKVHAALELSEVGCIQTAMAALSEIRRKRCSDCELECYAVCTAMRFDIGGQTAMVCSYFMYAQNPSMSVIY